MITEIFLVILSFTFNSQPACTRDPSSLVLSHTTVLSSVVIFAVPDVERKPPVLVFYQWNVVAFCDVNRVFKPFQFEGRVTLNYDLKCNGVIFIGYDVMQLLREDWDLCWACKKKVSVRNF